MTHNSQTAQQQSAVIAVAHAYLARGPAIQYDQLSMDRLLRITPRRNRFAPPEAASGQHILFLDCSSFVNAVYYTAFGRELPADITWDMMEVMEPKLYDYSTTHRETAADRARIQAEVFQLVRPGDCIAMRYEGNGHGVLCGERGFYYHCTEIDGGTSYHYDQRCDVFSPTGAIGREPLDTLFQPGARYDLLGPTMYRFVVLRPLEHMGPPTPATLARLGAAAGLQLTSFRAHGGGNNARPGGQAIYALQMENRSQRAQTAQIICAPPGGATLLTPPRQALSLAPGERRRIALSLRLPDHPGEAPCLPPPTISVNGLPVWAEHILLQQSWPEGVLSALTARLEDTARRGEDLLAALSALLRPLRIVFPDSSAALLSSWFIRYDSVAGDVLWRRPQRPWQDGGLYGFFGGSGVVTPEIAQDPFIRARHLRPRDLQPGDLIVCSDEPLFRKTYACLATRSGLAGRFSPDGSPGRLDGPDAARFLESLPGRFCYGVLRPSVIKGEFEK